MWYSPARPLINKGRRSDSSTNLSPHQAPDFEGIPPLSLSLSLIFLASLVHTFLIYAQLATIIAITATL